MANSNDKPKGKLIAIGGKEAKNADEGMLSGNSENAAMDNGSILTHVLAEMRGHESRIEILTTASEEPEEMARMYLKAFSKLGCTDVGVLQLDGRNVDSKDVLSRIRRTDGLFITGGNQARLIEKLSGTDFLRIVISRYLNENFTLAGTSAGAMALSTVMIREGESTESLLKGIVKTSSGFNFLPYTIIDTHFMSRGRFSRLAEALLMHEGFTALGICENTALVATQGELLRVIGSGVVMVLEAQNVQTTNFATAKNGEPIYAEGMQIHILAKGAMYSLADKRFRLTEEEN